MGGAAKKWMAAVEDPSKLVADNVHLAGELAASMRREQEILAENQKLKEDISDYEIEMRDRSDAAEKLARELNTERMQRKEYESLAKLLEKELAAAPHWVPVAEFSPDNCSSYFVSGGRFHLAESRMCECFYENEKWFWSGWQFSPTHVLVGLNPPVIERDVDPRGDSDIEEVVPDTDAKMTTEQMADALDTPNDLAGDASDIERAMRRRLVEPFLGSEAETLGATKYQLRDGERWECKELDEERWLPFLFGEQPAWASSLQYRLATGE